RRLAKIVVSMQIEKVYEPARFEPRWAAWWIESGIYHADAAKPGPYFSIVIPPPNVTGALHMGHMMEHSVIDVAVRWHRMKGYNTLWVPGVDHAGIATQIMVERHLASEGVARRDIGREAFEKRVGERVDWSRERFTLSPELSRAVIEAFVRLYERGLIYRGEYMVNWCPRCQTAISDL